MDSNEVTLRNCLNNFSPRSGASDEYCKGLLVGTASGLMAKGVSFPDAIKRMKHCMPKDRRPLTEANCPDCWLQDLQ